MLRGLFLALVLSGCGPGFAEHMQEERYYDACSYAMDEEGQMMGTVSVWTEHGDQLASQLLAQSNITVTVHAFTPDEIEQTLGYVPQRLQTGESLLLSTAVEVDGLRADGATITTRLSGEETRECCEPAAWLELDGRHEEAQQIREAEAAAEARREHERERFGTGFLGSIRRAANRLGGFAAGVGADLLYLSTLGGIDIPIDHGSLPTARLSPIQLLRTIGQAAANASPEQPTEIPDEARDLAERRARAALALGSLLEEQDLLSQREQCSFEQSGSCQVFKLVDVPEERELFVNYTLYLTEGGHCRVGGATPVPLGNTANLAADINAAFASGPNRLMTRRQAGLE